MNIPAFTLRHKPIVVAGTVLATAWGILSFFSMSRREDPDFRVNRCIVSTQWPGASAENVEDLVTDPVQAAIDELDEVRTVSSTSTIGYSLVDVELESNVDDYDATWDKIRAKMDEIAVNLPDGASKPFVDSEFGDTAAMVLAIYQDLPADKEYLRYTPRRLELLAEDLKDELKLLPAVARVDFFGVQKEVIYLETSLATWSNLALTTNQLQQLLQERNIIAPGGQIDTDENRMMIAPSGDFNAVDELNRVVVDSGGGPNGESRKPYLADLGIDVTRTFSDPPRQITRVSPQGADRSVPCVVLAFTMKGGKNIVDLGTEVRKAIDRARQSFLPADVKVALVSDQPRTVDKKIGEFMSNLYQAVLVVIIVAFLIVGLRVALVMAASIPIVMIISLGVNRMFGVELEQVSLASLIIALGMLVDCAIEVGDNIHRFLEEGYSRKEAAIQGSQQIAFPVLMGTLTTVFAFLPMLLLPGITGEYIYSLPVVVSTTLLLSWILALTVTTLLGFWIMRPGASLSPLGWLFGRLGAGWRRLFGSSERERSASDVYIATCRSCIRFKWLTIGVAGAMFGAALLLPATGMIGTQYFPSAYRDQFMVNVYLPNGSAIDKTDRVCRQIEQLIRDLSRDASGQPRLKNLVSYVGEGGPRFFSNVDPEPPQSNYAQIIVNTTSPEVATQYVREIRLAAQYGDPHRSIEPIVGARVVPAMLTMGPPIETPIGIRIYGQDPQKLHAVSDELKEILRTADGTVDVHDTWGAQSPQVNVEIDQEKAPLANISHASIARSLNTFYSGYELTTYREGDHPVPVILRLRKEERDDIAQLDRAYVEGRQGKIPLGAVANISTQWQLVKIEERNQNRMIEVRCRVEEDLLANSVLSQVRPAIDNVEANLPPGYRLEFGGELEKTIEQTEDMRVCLTVSLLLIVFALSVQFNSIAKPFIIMLALPMAVTGSLVGLYVTDMPLGFMAQLGLLSLAGIVINDSIVLIEFIEHMIQEKLERGEGVAGPGEKSCSGLTVEAFRDCVARGGWMRFLPICLTSLTTIGGLVPLALYGGPLFQPMAVVIMFGLALATVLTLFVVPALYAVVIENFGERINAEAPHSGEPVTA